jgi:CheY-like chemotaxis protein/DNA-binding XRE family transcriptional regulator
MPLADAAVPDACTMISSLFADLAAVAEPVKVRSSDPRAAPLHQRLGARLRLARRLARLSQTEAGQLLGVTFQQYGKYETGQNRISAVALHRLASHFQVSTEWFHASADQEPGAHGVHAALIAPETAMLLARFEAIRGRDDRRLLLTLAARLAGRAGAEPVTARGTATPAASDESAAAREAKHVLLVDDDRSALVVASAFLRKAEFEVTTATSGDEALQILATGLPVHVLVTDYAMPGLSGLDLVELALERRPDLPALVITGYGRDGELGRLPERVGVLSKPFARAEFIQRVQDLAAARVGG